MPDSPHLNRILVKSLSLNGRLVDRQELLRQSGARPILTLDHLARSMGVEWTFLRQIVRRSGRLYREIRIPKATGGYRTLHTPREDLKVVQRWILDNILTPGLKRHPDSFAYFPEVTMRACAQRHVGARWMIKSDIHSFFPSVGELKVYEIFRRMNYAPLLSFELARICTWQPTKDNDVSIQDELAIDTYLPTLPYKKLQPGFLPQGAPTSGALANAAMEKADRDFAALALDNELVYTRYSDDIAFSSSGTFDRGQTPGLIAQARAITRRAGFDLHQKKTQVIPPGSRIMLLGLLIGQHEVQLLPEHRRRMRLYVHCVEKYGLQKFAKHRGFDSSISFVNHVYGWLSYLSQIDPTWARDWEQRWEDMLLEQGIYPSSLR